jgi:hypothetical protein
MAPTIRIDDEVYRWLQSQAVPFDDSPNSVLRRLAGLDGAKPVVAGERKNGQMPSRGDPSPVYSRHTKGDDIVKEQELPVAQGRFREDGKFYEFPTKFPAALCDSSGYIIFRSEDEMNRSQAIQVSLTESGAMKINVSGGISSMTGYREYEKHR